MTPIDSAARQDETAAARHEATRTARQSPYLIATSVALALCVPLLCVAFIGLRTPQIEHEAFINLSGIARLPARQRIEDMQVRLKSAVPCQSLQVEELFVQAVEQAVSDSRQAMA